MKYLKALTTIASRVFKFSTYIQYVVNFLSHFSLNGKISEQIFNIFLI